MNFRKVNNIAGWIIGGIATLVYLLTMERTTSYWDCGEFLSVAYKLEVGHSPGAPFFMLLQRLFGILTFGDKMLAAPLINSWSAITSGLTILFLFWTITHLGRKLVAPNGAEPDSLQRILIIGAGAVGGLAYTFSDTFWFSAVEAEVYATSSVFTALTFWAMLKWENMADTRYADRWLVLIAYLIGISVGIHLLNLLTIPALAIIYYFRRYKVTLAGTFIAFLVGCVLLGLVQFGIIQGVTILAAKFDVWFVNSLGLPFDSGALFSILLLIAGLVALLITARRRGWYLAHTGVLCVLFILIGFSSYMVPMIRSRADVPIDMTNPDNTLSLVSYVQREQFGEQPLLRGPDFDAHLVEIGSKGPRYAKSKVDGKDHYEIVGQKPDYKFEEEKMRFFPRIWDNNDEGHQRFYANFLGIGIQKDQGGQDMRDQYGKLVFEREPTTSDNISFFMGYQMGHMWWRYFMWNYAGRQNDFEGQGEPKNGNWISGIGAFDKGILGVGDLDKMADGYRNNGARNQLYFLPFILGILGMVYQYQRDRRDFFIVGMLFFFTGIAIGIYLNMTPLQPRERDYAFAGSTYAFAIWIGLGVLMVYEGFRRVAKGPVAAFGAIALCLLAVPTLMAAEEWDDHDRSKKTLARATAWNTLMSCEKNAILFTYGDNETYPLWYLQEVEGVRPDVRIINTSLLGIDWYIDQLNYRVNDADAVPMAWKHEHYVGDRRNYLQYITHDMAPNAVNLPQDRFFNLKEICDFMNSPQNQLPSPNREEPTNYFPTKNFFLPAPSKADMVAGKLMYAADTARAAGEMKFTITKNLLQKSELAQLNILAQVAAEGWKRPIYFSNMQELDAYGDLVDYIRLEGTVYRVMPYKMNPDPVRQQRQLSGEQGFVDADKSLNLFMNTYMWGNADRRDVYYDEKNRQMFIPYRLSASRVADELTIQGRQAEAVRLLDKVMAGISEKSYPYDFSAFFIAQAYYHAGEINKGAALAKKVAKNAQDDVNWALSLKESSREAMLNDIQRDISMINGLAQAAQAAGDATNAQALNQQMDALVKRVSASMNLGAMMGGGR